MCLKVKLLVAGSSNAQQLTQFALQDGFVIYNKADPVVSATTNTNTILLLQSTIHAFVYMTAM